MPAPHLQGEGSDSVTACEIPEEVVVSTERQINDVILRWNSSNADFYEVHSAQDDFYFEPDTFSYWWETLYNSYTFLNDLGDPSYNFAYGIVAAMDCGETSGLSNRVGSFNFALFPGN